MKRRITRASNNQNEKNIYLPLSILVPYIIIISLLIVAIVVVAPIAIDYVYEYLHYYKRAGEIVILFFITGIILLILLISLLIRMNEKLKNKQYSHANIEKNLFYGKYDEDRSYLEKEIQDLNEKLLSTQNRWEEVNHLIMASHNRNMKNDGNISLEGFMRKFNVNMDNIKVDKKMVFVLTPFSDDNIEAFLTIKEICKELEFDVMRGDEELVTGDVLTHIIECIARSRVIIANLNGRNPNVFYELGIAHAMNKPTILITHNVEKIPFDIQNKFVVIYNSADDLSLKIKKSLLHILIDNKF